MVLHCTTKWHVLVKKLIENAGDNMMAFLLSGRKMPANFLAIPMQ